MAHMVFNLQIYGEYLPKGCEINLLGRKID